MLGKVLEFVFAGRREVYIFLWTGSMIESTAPQWWRPLLWWLSLHHLCYLWVWRGSLAAGFRAGNI
jgi:hypothetical protein